MALSSLLHDLSGTKASDLLKNPERWAERVEKSKYIVCKILSRNEKDTDSEMAAECR